MIVVSLFDGKACGLQALKNANVKVDEYHAFEIDKYAMEIAKKNHPEIIHHGSVVNFDFKKFKNADLLIGGSPCQGFSYAGKRLNFEDPRSKLFFEFVRAKKEINPRNFLLENVKMKQQNLNIITSMLGVKPVIINSSLVSAQNRLRYYWCDWEVSQPADRGITCNDIIISNDLSVNADGWQTWWGEKEFFQLQKHYSRIINDEPKAICMTARQIASWNGNLVRTEKGLRFINCIEAERLQTLPDGYTEGVSNTQRYKMIGNGWTVAVIQHIFEELYYRNIFS